MKVILLIILLLIVLCWLIAISKTLRGKKDNKYVVTYLWRGKRKKLTYMSFWQAYWYRDWLNMVDWIVIILLVKNKSKKYRISHISD